jgi:hypothetical protein
VKLPGNSLPSRAGGSTSVGYAPVRQNWVIYAKWIKADHTRIADQHYTPGWQTLFHRAISQTLNFFHLIRCLETSRASHSMIPGGAAVCLYASNDFDGLWRL